MISYYAEMRGLIAKFDDIMRINDWKNYHDMTFDNDVVYYDDEEKEEEQQEDRNAAWSKGWRHHLYFKIDDK